MVMPFLRRSRPRSARNAVLLVVEVRESGGGDGQAVGGGERGAADPGHVRDMGWEGGAVDGGRLRHIAERRREAPVVPVRGGDEVVEPVIGRVHGAGEGGQVRCADGTEMSGPGVGRLVTHGFILSQHVFCSW
jgi:hypothetical protein